MFSSHEISRSIYFTFLIISNILGFQRTHLRTNWSRLAPNRIFRYGGSYSKWLRKARSISHEFSKFPDHSGLLTVRFLFRSRKLYNMFRKLGEVKDRISRRFWVSPGFPQTGKRQSNWHLPRFAIEVDPWHYIAPTGQRKSTRLCLSDSIVCSTTPSTKGRTSKSTSMHGFPRPYLW